MSSRISFTLLSKSKQNENLLLLSIGQQDSGRITLFYLDFDCNSLGSSLK